MSTDDPQDPSDEAGSAAVLKGITHALVGLYKSQFGRGPTKARTDWANDSTLICVLEHTLAPAERSLVELGEHQRLRETRLIFQHATVEEFCRPVEQLTGRKVRAFHSSTDTEVDGHSVEVFVLHPAGYDGPSRADHVGL